MFELNDDLHVKEETILNSKVYTVDNFYKNPEEVSDYLFNRDVPLWKAEQKPSFNTVHFNDRRLIQREPRLIPVYEFLSKLCKQRYPNCDISTNMTKFFNGGFNDYNNYKSKYDNEFTLADNFLNRCKMNASKSIHNLNTKKQKQSVNPVKEAPSFFCARV